MYAGRSPPDIQSEMSWGGLVVAPRGGDDVWMYRVFPLHGRLVKGLLVLLAVGNGET